jgi:hypothetical protein
MKVVCVGEEGVEWCNAFESVATVDELKSWSL